MANKHDLSDAESGSASPETTSNKRKRTNAASSLPRSTPPADIDPDASEDGEEDEEEDEDQDMRDRQAVEELARTQSNRPQVRLPLFARSGR